MGVRQWLRKNHVIVAITVVIVVGAVLILTARGDRPAQPDSVWFYDLGSGKLFAAERIARPPIDAPDGGAGRGVKAMVYTCGACADEEMQIAFLATYSDDAHAAMDQLRGEPGADPSLGERLEQGSLVARVPNVGDEPKWVSKRSDDGGQIVHRATTLCGEDQLPTPCYP